MPRVTKAPDARKNDLVDAARALFLRKGFEKTQVSEIVAELGVAQGTFYYYFKSKDEVLMEIYRRDWAEFAHLSARERGAHGESLSATSSLRTIMAGFLKPPGEDGYSPSQYFGAEADPAVVELFHTRFDNLRGALFLPVITGIVKEGVQSGEFLMLPHLDEVVEVLFRGISSSLHALGTDGDDPGKGASVRGAVIVLLERILGLEPGTLCSAGFTEGEGSQG